MKHSKELHDLDAGSGVLSQLQSVFKHTCPVDDAMITVERQGIIFEDSSEDEGDVEFHGSTRLGSASGQ